MDRKKIFYLEILHFLLLMKFATLYAGNEHEHVHIKLHLPEMVKKHTHMKMVYKHHFHHPKKFSKIHNRNLDTFSSMASEHRPVLSSPTALVASFPEFGYKPSSSSWISTDIVEIGKPKYKHPLASSDWQSDIDLNGAIGAYSLGGGYANNFNKGYGKFISPATLAGFKDNLKISYPSHAFPKGLKHHYSTQNIEDFSDMNDEYIMEEDSSHNYPTIRNFYSSPSAQNSGVSPLSSNLIQDNSVSLAQFQATLNHHHNNRNYPWHAMSSSSSGPTYWQAQTALADDFPTQLDSDSDSTGKDAMNDDFIDSSSSFISSSVSPIPKYGNFMEIYTSPAMGGRGGNFKGSIRNQGFHGMKMHPVSKHPRESTFRIQI